MTQTTILMLAYPTDDARRQAWPWPTDDAGETVPVFPGQMYQTEGGLALDLTVTLQPAVWGEPDPDTGGVELVSPAVTSQQFWIGVVGPVDADAVWASPAAMVRLVREDATSATRIIACRLPEANLNAVHSCQPVMAGMTEWEAMRAAWLEHQPDDKE